MCAQLRQFSEFREKKHDAFGKRRAENLQLPFIRLGSFYGVDSR
jgi:hypothetical protein